MSINEVRAELILQELRDARPNGLDVWQLMAQTGLTYAQVRNAMAYVDDYLQLRDGTPRAWDPYYRWYTVSGTWVEHAPYIDFRTKSLLTQLRRYEKNLTASLAAFHGDNVARAEITMKLGLTRGAVAALESMLIA